jgi:polyhydroxyalkanoate synthase
MHGNWQPGWKKEESPMMDKVSGTDFPHASLEDMQHWTGVIGRAQQLLLEHATEAVLKAGEETTKPEALSAVMTPMMFGDPMKMVKAQTDFWNDGLVMWQRFLTPQASTAPSAADGDRRFTAPQWRDNPFFDLIRQSYLMMSDHLLKGVDALDGMDPRQKEKIRFATQSFVDAMSPSNFALTNPLVLEKIFETRGENLLKGIEHMLADIQKGQLTHTDPTAFEVGRNIAATPGKVVKETPLYQLIQYTPVTETVQATPLIIFPPWINRFYILDLNPKNSFIRWAVEQGLSVFVVSWKSADSSMADVTMDDYVLRGQIDAIDTVRDLLGVEQVHAIGYCVAGTTLAMTLAYLAEQGQAAKVASATFFTAQVDFSAPGELNLFVDDEQLELTAALAKENGYLDGRYMALTFNLLRGRDLIWAYVVNNYLLGQDYPTFDLLHWNGDTTNLPAKWHRAYLEDFYRDNKLVRPGALKIGDTPIDLRKIETPAYVQAGREDHIAPAASVWKITEHFKGPLRFVLAGSGHIAGVVNPPSAGKYQYWINEQPAANLAEFIEGSIETKGSWWPDWLIWIGERSGGEVPVKGARIPGKGRFKAIEDAPGRYVRTR